MQTGVINECGVNKKKHWWRWFLLGWLALGLYPHYAIEYALDCAAICTVCFYLSGDYKWFWLFLHCALSDILTMEPFGARFVYTAIICILPIANIMNYAIILNIMYKILLYLLLRFFIY